jgi:Fur family ferric uptake transcriptional regulator
MATALPPTDDPIAPLLAPLAAEGIRLTGPRRGLAALIAGRAGHFTAAELIADAEVRGLPAGRATVFRTLELLAERGLVERLDLPSGEHAYVRCEPRHHHHVVCGSCGASVEVPDCGLRAVADEVARRTGYRIDRHRLELYGICPACAGTGAA